MSSYYNTSIGKDDRQHDYKAIKLGKAPRKSVQSSGFESTDQRGKKQRQRKGSSYDSDNIDDNEAEDSERSYDDSFRFPSYPEPRNIFACPFQKYDPVRYVECLNVQPSRLSDIISHIQRQHVVNEIILTTPDAQTSKTIIRPEDECRYCPRCRREFRGVDALQELFRHRNVDQCKICDIWETGVLLPHEVGEIIWAVPSVNGDVEKWNLIWSICFPRSATPSPYLEMGVPQPEAQQILQQLPKSSAAKLWASTGKKHSKMQKSLSETNIGLPPTEIESQVNDASINLSADIYDPARYGESSLDAEVGTISSFHDPSCGYFGTPNSYLHDSHYQEGPFDVPGYLLPSVPKSPVDRYKIGQQTSSLKTAIENVEHDKVHAILSNSFNKAAVDEYAWLLELKALGLSIDEIADELLERAQYGPWIHSKFNVPDVETFSHDFHIAECLHTGKEDESMPTVSTQPNQAPMSIEADSENSVRESIQYFCGIGGVSPLPDGSPSLQFGSVAFEDTYSTAIASLVNNQSSQVITEVLQHLEMAFSTLQQAGGCCDSFTFLARQQSLVDLTRITPGGTSRLESLITRTSPETSLESLNLQLLDSLTAQFLSLAFALYAQGHCEPFGPFFLDTPLKRILLIGNQCWGPSFMGPCILVSPVELTCFSKMLQCRVFAFQYFDSFERSKVFSDSGGKFDLKAFPEDLLDTWGPGEFIIPKDDSENLHAISIGGGLITSARTNRESSQLPALHWSPASEDNIRVSSSFPRHRKLVIGSRISINQACRMTPQEQVRVAVPWLKELGTFPSYWEVSERQLGLGLQAGQNAVGIVNFAQTWAKRLGQTKKSSILSKRYLAIADLEAPFSVQVSFCTGIARRVPLRELLADVLPVYVMDLATQPCYWKRLQESNICEMLRDTDFRTRYQKLDRELQAEFETLAIATLFVLQDTGVDRKGENFVVGCIPRGLGAQCFKIPIEKESFWARILADSEDVATFAYMATSCFETDLVKCRGPNKQWMNTTALFSTAVSLCQDLTAAQGTIVQQTNWTLKDSEAYLIGRVDAPLLVRVIRPNIQDEPELLVSLSTIIAPFLRRWSRKQGYKRPWRLRESRAIDYQHQLAESVVVIADFTTS